MQIISASRRTDIPAFYGEWFINRIRAGYCLWKNPFNAKQISRVSLAPEDVIAIVFWTKNPRPFFRYLPELDSRGYRYYFQFTVNGYGPEMEPYLPPLAERIDTFRRLAEMVGPKRVIWRYDPIVFSNVHTTEFHREKFASILAQLRDYTRRVVVSIVDDYRKATVNFRRLKAEGITVAAPPEPVLQELASFLAAEAKKAGLEIQSCAENLPFLRRAGIMPGKCVDADLIEKIFSLSLPAKYHLKDKSQRAECGCVVSKDIGVYDTCLHGCKYCYAGSYETSRKNYARHDPASPLLVGNYEEEGGGGEGQMSLFMDF
ncbi:MAG: hypothetical protein PWQ31_1305 [Eubacteriales bacterium]|nr:hypothetical protein [Eubacteriales bacterium]